MATMMAPPSIATTSRVKPVVVKAAPPVCRLGEEPVVVVLPEEPVAWTCTIVVEVMVLKLPSGKVVVLLYVEV
jgi:hypothetical protein